MPTPKIPDDILLRKKSPFSFCVYFFGSHNYGWIFKSQSYCYHEDDAKSANVSENLLNKAMNEADKYYAIMKREDTEQISAALASLKPKPYIEINTNRIAKKMRRNTLAERPTNSDGCFECDKCNCSSTDNSPCSDDKCLNRIMKIECCADYCEAKDKCQNQCFKNGSKYRFEVKYTDSKGFGLFAMQQIPSNQFIIEYVGEVIDKDEYNNRNERIIEIQEMFYFLILNNETYIDATRYGNVSRFINHSCKPNAFVERWTVSNQLRIGFFALRDISPVSV